MGLHGVLSAIRCILLDFDSLPPDANERHAFLRRTFSDLSDEEIADLAKISPERLDIYKMTIFNGEAATLRNHFRMSFAVCASVWKNVFGERFLGSRLMKQMHKVRPWSTTTTDGLATNLVTYLSHDLPELVQAAPQIRESVWLEYSNICIKRYPDPAVGPRDSLGPDDIAPLTVEELLALPCRIPGGVQTKAFEFDVIGALAYFNANDNKLPEPIVARTVLGIGSRNAWQRPVWLETKSSVFSFFQNMPQNEIIPLQVFAEACLADAGEVESEEVLFSYFMNTMFDFIKSGALVVTLAS